MNRVGATGKRWLSAFRRNEVSQLQDTRKFNSGRPSDKDLSIEEKFEKLQAKLKLLETENELLKKLDMIERGVKIKK